MNVFDFDNTIYDGESSFDFFKFCMRKKPSLARYMPRTMAMLMKYKTGMVSKREVMEFCAMMLRVLADNIGDLDRSLDQFWQKNGRKLKPVILEMLTASDAVISASPSFLFNGIKDRLNGARLITTEINLDTMEIESLCYGENKVKEYKKHFGSEPLVNYYTDNMNDMPMIRLAQNAWLVKGNDIKRIKIQQA
ncbi:MAG: HAD-IB family phosphatase [Candidatus Ornithomonoglobus sp.]